jgi:hypothetical protein
VLSAPIFVLAFSPLIGFSNWSPMFPLRVGLLFGLPVGLVAGAVSIRSTQNVSCVETVHWSWSEFWNHLISRSASGLFEGLALGLLVGFMIGLTQEDKVAGVLVLGTLLGLAGGLSVGAGRAMLGGLVGREIETRSLPNQGVWRSARNGLWIGPLSGLLGAVVFWLSVFWLFAGSPIWLGFVIVLALFIGLIVGLQFGLQAGGEVFLKHWVLRAFLVYNGSAPWNYVRFLDYAADRILLRKVGGGYVFLHRMLMDWFADRYVEPAVGGMEPAKPFATEQPS